LYSPFADINFTEITETETTHADLRFAQSNTPLTAWGYDRMASALADLARALARVRQPRRRPGQDRRCAPLRLSRSTAIRSRYDFLRTSSNAEFDDGWRPSLPAHRGQRNPRRSRLALRAGEFTKVAGILAAVLRRRALVQSI
jgi:hypothetical protein